MNDDNRLWNALYKLEQQVRDAAHALKVEKERARRVEQDLRDRLAELSRKVNG